MIIVSIVLIIISSIARAISNKIQFHYDNSIFRKLKWFNPLTSWKNKWKLKDNKIVYKNNKPKERFIGSSTIFVLFTDAWHLFESISKYSLIFSIAICFYFNYPLWWLIILIFIMVITFHIFFTYIFSKK